MGYTNPFNGDSSDSCSVSAAYMADNAKALKKKGMSEAAFNKGQNLGAWGVHKGLLDTYPNGKTLFKADYIGPGPSSGQKYQVYKDNSVQSKIILENLDTGVEASIDADNLEVLLQSDKWEWKAPGTPLNTSVSPGSASPGSMSDVDVATMFVKIKDDIAKDKGINIKGANPQLDAQVYKSIGDQIGYTPAEVKAKVEAYKATGKKLSALKKKTVAKAPKGQVIPPSPPGPSAAAPAPASVGLPVVQAALKAIADVAKTGGGTKAKIGDLVAKMPALNQVTNKAYFQGLADWTKKHNIDETSAIPLAKKYGKVVEDWDPSTTVYRTQDSVLVETLKSYVTGMKSFSDGVGDVDAPLLIRVNGKYHLADGHHRYVAAKLTDKKITVRVLDLDNDVPLPPELGLPDSAYAKKVAQYEKMYDAMTPDQFSPIAKSATDNPHLFFPDMLEAIAKVKTKQAVTPEVEVDLEAYLNSVDWTKPSVPLEVADDVVKAAQNDALQALPTYTDEQVTKAYIKAKDQLAATDSNPWTLYTQGNAEFEEAIVKLMQKSYDIDLEASQVKAQLARYTSEGNKVSVLKKKMAKTGEYVPQANTLKKTKGQKVADSGPTTKTQAQAQIADLAGDYTPDGVKPYTFGPSDEEAIFDGLKNSIYKGAPMESIHNYVKTYIKTAFANTDPKPSMLDIIRVYDKKKAAQLGIDNGNFYEKKIVEWAASPEGKTAMMSAEAKAAAQAAKDKAEAEFLANLPPLPTDSKDYLELSTSQALELQNRLRPWEGRERPMLREYTGGAYRTINRNLRANGTPTADDRERQAGMRAVDRPFLTHRGTGYSQFGVTSKEELYKLLGTVGQDKGFLSTSVGGRAAFGGEVRMEVEWPTGSYGAYVDHISMHKGENEFLGAAGQQFTILSIKPEGYQTVVRVRMIPGSHRKM